METAALTAFASAFGIPFGFFVGLMVLSALGWLWPVVVGAACVAVVLAWGVA